MADINKAIQIVYKAEYELIVSQALHIADGENFLTYKGIQERDDPDFAGWGKIRTTLKECGGDRKRASVLLETDYTLQKMTVEFFKTRYWDTCRLDEIANQHTANEIFVASVLYSPKKAIILAQRVVGEDDDGVMGKDTLAALNAFDAFVFDKEYDEAEIDRAEMLAEKNPKLAINLKGWIDRARAV